MEFELAAGSLRRNRTTIRHYKFSWNPRNVVLAGQGGAATFLSEKRAWCHRTEHFRMSGN